MIKTGSECPLIRDICEMYREKRVSAQTKAYVEAHLAVCTQCREYYQEQESSTKADAERSRYARVAKKIRNRRILLLLLVMALVTGSFIAAFQTYQVVSISGSCMEPSIRDGEKYILNKWTYKLGTPEKYDIVIYREEGIYYTSRIYALPGEKVSIEQGEINVDGTRTESFTNLPDTYRMDLTGLGVDEYLLITDNFQQSDHGCQIVSKGDIVGRVWITH